MTDIATDADDTPDTNRAARTTDPESDAKEDTQGTRTATMAGSVDSRPTTSAGSSTGLGWRR